MKRTQQIGRESSRTPKLVVEKMLEDIAKLPVRKFSENKKRAAGLQSSDNLGKKEIRCYHKCYLENGAKKIVDAFFNGPRPLRLVTEEFSYPALKPLLPVKKCYCSAVYHR